MSAQSEDLKTQLAELIDSLIDLSNEGPYSAELNKLIDESLLLLQTLQDDLSNDAETEIIAGLTEHNQELADLNTAIDNFAKNLDATAVKIKSIADTVGVVAGIVAGIVSSGIL